MILSVCQLLNSLWTREPFSYHPLFPLSRLLGTGERPGTFPAEIREAAVRTPSSSDPDTLQQKGDLTYVPNKKEVSVRVFLYLTPKSANTRHIWKTPEFIIPRARTALFTSAPTHFCMVCVLPLHFSGICLVCKLSDIKTFYFVLHL